MPVCFQAPLMVLSRVSILTSQPIRFECPAVQARNAPHKFFSGIRSPINATRFQNPKIYVSPGISARIQSRSQTPMDSLDSSLIHAVRIRSLDLELADNSRVCPSRRGLYRQTRTRRLESYTDMGALFRFEWAYWDLAQRPRY